MSRLDHQRAHLLNMIFLILFLVLSESCLPVRGEAYFSTTKYENGTTRLREKRATCPTCGADPVVRPVAIAPVVNPDASHFTVKHMYDPEFTAGVTAPKNSYTDLNTPDRLLEKVITMDFADFANSDILTQAKNPDQVRKKWEAIAKKGGVKTITLIDNANPALLALDFDQTTKIAKAGGTQLYETQNTYQVTHLTLKYDPSVDPNLISINKEQFEGKLHLKTKPVPGGGDQIYHLEKVDDTAVRIQNVDDFASITIDRIEEIAKSKAALRQDYGIDNKDHPNEKRQDFVEQVQHTIACTSSFRRKRRSGGRSSGCNFSPDYQDPEFTKTNTERERWPDQDTVKATDFVEAYKKSSGEDRTSLMEEIKTGGKTFDGDSESVKKAVALVQREELNGHVDLVRQTDIIQNPKNNKNPGIFSLISQKIKNQRVKMSHTALARGVSKFANSKRVKSFTKGLGKVSNAVGKYFLAKGIITGIIHGDTTSLGIMGGRLALEYGPKGLTKLFKNVKYLGKGAKYLSKVAGPLGTAIDFGLSIWSLSKSVTRLTNAKDKFGRNDAIADVVEQAIDIYVSTVSLVLSIAFPPAAPLILLAAFFINTFTSAVVKAYKVSNQIDKINEQIPLLDFEKVEQFNNRIVDIFGIRKPDYVDNLVAVKKANNFIVKHNLETLRAHAELAGIVFPSRTVTYTGPCYLTKRHCSFDWGPVLGCTWEAMKTVGRDCENRGSTCNKIVSWTEIHECVDRDERCENGHSFDRYACKCDDAEEKSEGLYPRLNNIVDFTQKQQVYLERSVPDDVSGAKFKCKPGSLSDQGYRVSQRGYTYDYHCDGAIALLQTYHGTSDNQIMLFALEDGTDVVKQARDSRENNHYEITKGHKEFSGGAGTDTFQLTGPCTPLSGDLDGGGGQDTLTLGEGCRKGSPVQVDFSVGQVQLGSGALRVRNIEVFQGRGNAKEVVVVTPSILHVDSAGGTSYYEPDVIKIPDNPYSNYSLTVLVKGHTNIISEARRGRINIVGTDKETNNVNVEINVPTAASSASSALSIATSFGKLKSESTRIQTGVGTILDNKRIVINFKLTDEQSSGQSKYEFKLNLPTSAVASYMSGFYFIFNEDSAGSVSYLNIRPSFPFEATVHHPLTLTNLKSTRPSSRRTGSTSVKNTFDLKDGTWQVIGGPRDDEFFLHADNSAWSIDGQEGNDVLQFDSSLKDQHLDINLASGSGLKGRLSIANINTVIVPKDFAAHVTCGCDTTAVYAMGGASLQQVTVPHRNCWQQSLEILVTGYSRLSILEPVALPNYVLVSIASAFQRKKQPLNFTASVLASSGVAITVQHDGTDWVQDRKVSGSRAPVGGKYRVKLSNPEGEIVDFELDFSALTTNISEDTGFFTQPSINFETSNGHPQGQLIIVKATGIAKFFHILNTESPVFNRTTDTRVFQRRGMDRIQNVFQLLSTGPWNVVGGHEDDLFSVQAISVDGMMIDGGPGGENVLTFSSAVDNNASTMPVLTVNLVAASSKAEVRGQGGVFKGFHHVSGRENLPDIINVDCGVKTASGNGGSEKYYDKIIIRNNCSQLLKIQIAPHTIVENSARTGKFYYTVTNAGKSQLNLESTGTNSHSILFYERPWEIIDAVTFDSSTSRLKWRLKTGATHEYSMAKVQDDAYRNPEFKFQSDAGGILCQLHATPDGTTHTVYKVHQIPPEVVVSGLPVTINNFVINITQPVANKAFTGGIQGSDFRSDNNFFLYNLQSPLRLLDGKGLQESSNQLQLSDEFFPNETVVLDMNIEAGKLSIRRVVADYSDLRSNDTVVIQLVKNINEFVGRRNGLDIVYPHCNTTSISMIEEIIIAGDPSCISGYNLIMEIGLETNVRFESDMGDEIAEDLYPAEGAFHYRFVSPRSFDIEGSDYVDGIHTYFLPFQIEQLESMVFVNELETLTYLVRISENGIQNTINCSHKMIESLNPGDQFYPQPRLVTEDGFSIRISRTGEVTMILGSESFDTYASLTDEEIRQALVPRFQGIAKRLEITIIAALSSETVLYVGHGPSYKDRNVLQNSVNFTSHLVGGGAEDTIYDIGDLQKDVYIYPSFELEDCDLEPEPDAETSKQTIDLSDVVAAIRQMDGSKYVPETANLDSDLVISMNGYEDSYPGKVTVVDGARCSSKLKLILYASTMSFKLVNQSQPLNETQFRSKRSAEDDDSVEETPTQWVIAPDPIVVPQGYLYTIYPEDLEIGHEIRFQRNSSENGTSDSDIPITSFQVARNGSDLFFTDMKAAQSRGDIEQVTTIVLAGFSNTLLEETLGTESNETGRNETSEWDETSTGSYQSDLTLNFSNPGDVFEFDSDSSFAVLDSSSLGLPDLMKVLSVSVNLPNVELRLNDTVIEFYIPHAENYVKGDPEDLSEILYEVEDSILQDFPDIPREFPTKRIAQQHCPVAYFSIVLIPAIALFVAWRRKYRASWELETDAKRWKPSGIIPENIADRSSSILSDLSADSKEKL